jgi:toxin ParE1/3/4
MTRFRLTQAAQADIIEILAWSHVQFGQDARMRYEALIVAAIRDAATHRDGTLRTSRPELGDGVFTWHLRHGRNTSKAGVVHRPRHFLICREDEGLTVIGRVLHDAMDLRRHVDPDSSWE